MFDANMLNNIANHLAQSACVFSPEIAMLCTFLIALFMDVVGGKVRNIAGYTICLGFIITGVLLGYQNGISQTAFVKLIAVDPFAVFFKYLTLFAGFIVALMSFFSDEINKDERKVGEYYSLIAGMTFGMFLMVGATNLMMVYLAVEILSLTSYVLAGFTKEIKRASEASLKYVIYGSVSSGVMVYGMSILFGATGSLNFADISILISSGKVAFAPMLVSGLMILAGFGYKISAAPFHFWTPDVYEGAPVAVTAFLSVASKAAGFAGFIRFSQMIFATSPNVDWQIVLAILATITMTLGNLSAIWQTNAKRLLAYSSIAHAGYMLMGMVVMNEIGISAILVYMFMYAFMNLGAFAVVMFISNKIGSEELEDYNGLGYRMPVLCGMMVIFLVSLAGLPPTAGFIGKLYIFTSLFNSGSQWLWLAIVGVINSVISLFYYAKIFRNMYLRGNGELQERIDFSPASIAIVAILAVPTLILGVYFSPIVSWASASASIFIGK
jgi:NADH-quinone oxidoreductase subunit N